MLYNENMGKTCMNDLADSRHGLSLFAAQCSVYDIYDHHENVPQIQV